MIPCFVARDMGNLPPITFNSIDVSVLLAKIESMHEEGIGSLFLDNFKTCRSVTILLRIVDKYHIHLYRQILCNRYLKVI